VAKSLGEGTGKVAGVAGGAILGDGRVGLILDPSGLIGLARGGSNWEHRAVLEAVA
jgi:two-component system chemotaxis sensor kinase CheA